MNGLGNTIVRRLSLDRTWHRLALVLVILAVALPASAPVVARSCNPSLTCELVGDEVQWTASGLQQGAWWKVEWSGSEGTGYDEFYVEPGWVDVHTGCYVREGSFEHEGGAYSVELFLGTGQDAKLKWHFRDACAGAKPEPEGEDPIAVDDFYTTLMDTAKVVGAPGVLGNDYAGDCGESLKAELEDGPSNGIVAWPLSGDGAFIYTPDPGFTGEDTFTYWATCSEVEPSMATVHIYVDTELPEPEPEPACTRADVSAIIYGGWDGIPVQATVGGSAQETLYTALDSSGEAAVLWTFYPPEGETWSVVVTPELPGGLDPERWKYEPASKSVSIGRCSEHQVTFQLVNVAPEVEVILPVTGGELSWWQGLVRWLRGMLGR